MTDWLRCDLHGAYEGAGECPCCLSTGGQEAAPESTPCPTRALVNVASSAVAPATGWQTAASGVVVSQGSVVRCPAPLTAISVRPVSMITTTPVVGSSSHIEAIRARWEEAFGRAYKALDCNRNSTATRIATLEAENATLRAQLLAAHEALAGVRIAQEAAVASTASTGPTEPCRPVAPLERATGVGQSQPSRAVLAALAGRVVR